MAAVELTIHPLPLPLRLLGSSWGDVQKFVPPESDTLAVAHKVVRWSVGGSVGSGILSILCLKESLPGLESLSSFIRGGKFASHLIVFRALTHSVGETAKMIRLDLEEEWGEEHVEEESRPGET